MSLSDLVAFSASFFVAFLSIMKVSGLEENFDALCVFYGKGK